MQSGRHDALQQAAEVVLAEINRQQLGQDGLPADVALFCHCTAQVSPASFRESMVNAAA